MKATKHIPEPLPLPPATVTLEMTEKEATALMALTGSIGTAQIKAIFEHDYEQEYLRRNGLSTDLGYNGELQQAIRSAYYALGLPGQQS